MDNNLDNNQGGRRPDKGDPRRDQDPNRNKKNHQSILIIIKVRADRTRTRIISRYWPFWYASW